MYGIRRRLISHGNLPRQIINCVQLFPAVQLESFVLAILTRDYSISIAIVE